MIIRRKWPRAPRGWGGSSRDDHLLMPLEGEGRTGLSPPVPVLKDRAQNVTPSVSWDNERGLAPTISVCRDMGKEKGIEAPNTPRTALGSPEINMAPRGMPLNPPEPYSALTVGLGVCMAPEPLPGLHGDPLGL